MDLAILGIVVSCLLYRDVVQLGLLSILNRPSGGLKNYLAVKRRPLSTRVGPFDEVKGAFLNNVVRTF